MYEIMQGEEMSLPIKETPVLTGRDAERFAESARSNPIPREDCERALRAYRELDRLAFEGSIMG
jgi:hypothetical protein